MTKDAYVSLFILFVRLELLYGNKVIKTGSI